MGCCHGLLPWAVAMGCCHGLLPWAVASASPWTLPGTGWGPNLANKDLIMDIAMPHVGQRIDSISYCNEESTPFGLDWPLNIEIDRSL